jgi:hypothetical protein
LTRCVPSGVLNSAFHFPLISAAAAATHSSMARVPVIQIERFLIMTSLSQ